LILISLGESELSGHPLILFSRLKKSLQRSKKTLLFGHVHLMTAYYESLFTNLESLAEEQPKLKFIFHFAQNILTERISRQLQDVSLPYGQLDYLSLDGHFSAEPGRFLRLLNDNEQVILRQIFRRRFVSRPELQADLDYLQRTGLVKYRRGNWLIAWPELNRFFYQEVSSGGELERVDNRFFFEGEEITRQFSPIQQKLLAGLLSAAGRLVKKERLARLIWDQNWCEVSDWALDKAIARLRRKLIILTGQNFLQVKKGAGIILSSPKSPNPPKSLTARSLSPLILNKSKIVLQL
jgi:hypothetical protein